MSENTRRPASSGNTRSGERRSSSTHRTSGEYRESGERRTSGEHRTSSGYRSANGEHRSGSRPNPNGTRNTANGNRRPSGNKKGKKRLTKKQRQQRKIIIAVEIIVLIVVVICLTLYMKLRQVSYNDIGTIEVNEDLNTEALKGYKTIAFFGVDNRSVGNYESGNSDSIMVAAINEDTKEVKIISVYRDTFLDVDGEGTLYKCNYAYNHGGVEQALAMLNRNLDLDIQDYVAVDFNALVDAIDAVGGIEMTLTAEEAQIMNDSYINETAKVAGKTANMVSAGDQILDGVQATAYCRVRYTSGDDFRRAQRQREVLEKLVEKIKTSNVAEINSLVDAILPEVSTSFTTSEILSLAADAASYTIADTSGFPYKKCTGTYGKKGSVVVPCELYGNVILLHASLYNDSDYTPTDEVKSISDAIVNYTGKTDTDAVDYGY